MVYTRRWCILVDGIYTGSSVRWITLELSQTPRVAAEGDRRSKNSTVIDVVQLTYPTKQTSFFHACSFSFHF